MRQKKGDGRKEFASTNTLFFINEIRSYFKDDSILSALTLLLSYAYFTRILQGRINYSVYIVELQAQTIIV